MSDLHHELIRIHQETGNAEAVANPRQMRAARIVEGAFSSDGRLRLGAMPLAWPGEWDGDHPIIGPVHIWYSPSTSTLRAKSGAPGSETDGTALWP